MACRISPLMLLIFPINLYSCLFRAGSSTINKSNPVVDQDSIYIDICITVKKTPDMHLCLVLLVLIVYKSNCMNSALVYYFMINLNYLNLVADFYPPIYSTIQPPPTR